MSSKRPRNKDEASEERPQKRTKQEIAESAAGLVDDIEEKIKAFNQGLPLEYQIGLGTFEIPRDLLKSGTSGSTLSAQIKEFKGSCEEVLGLVSIQLDETQRMDLNQRRMRFKLRDGRLILAKVISMADELQSALLSKPAPSEYAHASTWMLFQTYPRPILCLRPTNKHGLPLVLLHQIFSQFQQLSRQSLPNSVAGVNALRVASGLCGCMGDGFAKEKARSKAFDDMMGAFLQGAHSKTQLFGNKCNGDADRIYRINGRCVIIREDKVEMGAAGDAYTQVARSYDLACERMDDNGVTSDAPVFLLCVMGPSLIIAGGFKDGEDTVVEPLCPILLMLKDQDNANGRAMQLAAHLLALRTCLEQLPNIPNPTSHASGMPRVFPSFRDAQDVEHTLTFQRRLSKDLLLFSALDEQAQEVCVKIVYRPYGENVHRLLSHEGMAPKLLGVSRTDGGPNVIVMEMLNDPWQTLYTFAQCNSRWSADGVQPAIRKRLEEILAKLEAGGFVHGDFRANNIMVNPDDEKLAVLVDFDWAGEAGKVHYPLDRNHSRIQWPGEPASAISVGHDQFMLQTQWASLLNQQFS